MFRRTCIASEYITTQECDVFQECIHIMFQDVLVYGSVLDQDILKCVLLCITLALKCPVLLQLVGFILFADVHYISTVLFCFQYADPVANLLDKWGVFRARLFRESCVFHRGNYVKDLSRLGRDLHKVVIMDNSPASYIFHPDNAVSEIFCLYL